MPTSAQMFLFVGFPYLALALAVVVTILRIRLMPYKYSSLSSQFLENRQLYWGSNFWHWGILWVLGGHIAAFLIPSWVVAWNAHPVRLMVLESSALIGGLLALFGVLALLVRRLSDPRVKVVSTRMDYLLLAALLVQIVTGVDTALRYRWGSTWYATNAVPYLRSLVILSPRLDTVLSLPLIPRIHILNAFVLFAMIPFTRLLHFLAVPIQYLWRRPQVVMWNRKPSR